MSRTTSKVPLSLLAALGLALAVRAVYWSEVRDVPLFQQPSGDAATNLNAAAALRADGPLAPHGEPYTQAPLYPWFLALAGAAGVGTDGVRWIQFLLGTAGAGLFWLLGRRWGGPRAAAVSGIGAAVYGPLVFFDAELLSISLAVFLLLAGLTAWGRSRAHPVAGAAFGLASLAQPNLLLAGAAVLGAAVWRPGSFGVATRRAALLAAGLFVLAPAVTLTRNLLAAGEAVVISANGGVNFYIGNNRHADGTFHLPPESGLLNRPEGLFTSAREAAEADRGRPLAVREVDRFWWNRGLDLWLDAPGRALGLFGRKVLLALNDYETPNHFDYDYVKRHAPVLRILPTLGCLLPLAVLGLAWGRRRRPHETLLFAAILVSVALFFVTARYRLPLVVVLFPAAGLAVDRLWVSRTRWRRLVPPLAVAALVAVLAFFPLVRPGLSQAHMLNLEGAARYGRGDVAGAMEAFTEAVALNPGNAEALNNLGRMHYVQGDPLRALEFYRRALAADPVQSETYFNLEELYRRGGRPAEAMQILDRFESIRAGNTGDVPGALAYRRGLNQLASGDTAAAAESFRRGVAENPDLGGAWGELAGLDLAAGNAAAALDKAGRAAALAPRNRDAQLAWGRALEATGDSAAAVAAYQRAWALEPSLPEAPFRIGALYRKQGDLVQAEGHLRAAVEKTPFAPALLELGGVYEDLDRPRDAIIVYQVLARDAAGSPEGAAARERLQALRRGSGGR